MNVNQIRNNLINAVDTVNTVEVSQYCQQIASQPSNVKDSIIKEPDDNGSTVLTLAQRKANDETNNQRADSQRILEYIKAV